jgi:hypothetical protein
MIDLKTWPSTGANGDARTRLLIVSKDRLSRSSKEARRRRERRAREDERRLVEVVEFREIFLGQTIGAMLRAVTS